MAYLAPEQNAVNVVLVDTDVAEQAAEKHTTKEKILTGLVVAESVDKDTVAVGMTASENAAAV